MTKQEMIEVIVEKLDGFSIPQMKELARFILYLEWKREISDFKEQYEDSLRDVVQSDLYSQNDTEQEFDAY